jgi:stress-induced morphogen
MGFAEKILNALQEPLGAEYIHLTDDDGMSGFVVSSRFENMSGLERQRLIDRALRNASDPLSEAEQRRIPMIAGLTPLE